ncbi:hypothetical protein [Deefgea rivuli]|uniref:hypothetical protein n=1 Tax=Deefgea rivuli TaxID=400948 RepID=UPI0012EC3713|nr:hypothetical protein [Deefgea rivuli]
MSKTISRASDQLAPTFSFEGYLPTDLNEVLAQRRKQQAEVTGSCMAKINLYSCGYRLVGQLFNWLCIDTLR